MCRLGYSKGSAPHFYLSFAEISNWHCPPSCGPRANQGRRVASVLCGCHWGPFDCHLGLARLPRLDLSCESACQRLGPFCPRCRLEWLPSAGTLGNILHVLGNMEVSSGIRFTFSTLVCIYIVGRAPVRVCASTCVCGIVCVQVYPPSCALESYEHRAVTTPWYHIENSGKARHMLLQRSLHLGQQCAKKYVVC